jgi:hypothetical protein
MKYFLRTLIIIILLIVSLHLLLNQYILPKKMDLVKDNLAQALNREVSFDKLSYSLIGGVVIENLAVKAKEGLPFEYFMKSEKVSFNLLPLFIQNKTIITLKAKSKIENLKVKTQDLILSGDLDLNSILKYDLKERKLVSVEGSINFKEMLVEGVPYIEKVESLSGKCSFDENKIDFKDSRGRILNWPFAFTGSVENYDDPYLNLRATSEFKLGNILKLLPIEKISELDNIQVEGRSQAEIKIRGRIREPASLDIRGGVSLFDVSIIIKEPAFDLVQINGKINLSKNKAELEDLAGFLRNTKYALEGSLTDYTEPSLKLRILSENFFSAIELDKEADLVLIKKLEGNYYQNKFNLTGQVSNLASPLFNVYGSLSLNLSEIDKFIPHLSSLTTALEPEGLCTASFHFKGEPGKWRKAEAGLKANSDLLTAGGLKLNNFYLNGSMINEKIYIRELSFAPYGGRLKATGKMNLETTAYLSSVDLLVEELDLAQLSADTKLKDKGIDGLAHLRLNLAGPLKDLNDLQGNGRLSVIEGHLFELPLLADLAAVIGLSHFEKIVFREGHCDFIIEDRRVSTENLTLISESLSLKSRGSVDFDGDLNFITNIELSEKAYEGLGKPGQVVSVFFDILGKFLISIRTTGNISEPNHETIPISPKEIIREGIIKGIGDIFRIF